MKRIVKALVIVGLFVVNLVGLWLLFRVLGIKDIPPIGVFDRAGLVLPPRWFAVPVAGLTLIEYVIIYVLISVKREKSSEKEGGG